MQQLRPFQVATVQDALDWLRCAQQRPDQFNRRLYTAPTGCGKGTIQLALLRETRAMGLDSVLMTPSAEIIKGMLSREGIEYRSATKTGAEFGIVTPVKFRNMLRSGDLVPELVIGDESHEDLYENDVSREILAYLGSTPILGFTATPYRGTNAGTRELQRQWGPAIECIGFKEAIDLGYISFPEIEIKPLVDDDKITVSNGEFSGGAADKATKPALGAIAKLVTADPRPTIVSAPSVTTAKALAALTPSSRVIVAGTSETERQEAMAASRAGAPLIQVSVLTRGADMPWLRRLIDAQPTRSSVRFMQTLGRIMRPGPPCQFISTNRNLERHSYLLEGFCPIGRATEVQAAFGSPSRRTGARELGIEGMERLRALNLPLANGGWATCFRLFKTGERGVVVDFCCITVPGTTTALWATRSRRPRHDAQFSWDYEPWRETHEPSDVSLLATTPSRAVPITPKQRDLWLRSASALGLAEQPMGVGRREFDCFMTLLSLKKRIL